MDQLKYSGFQLDKWEPDELDVSMIVVSTVTEYGS